MTGLSTPVSFAAKTITKSLQVTALWAITIFLATNLTLSLLSNHLITSPSRGTQEGRATYQACASAMSEFNHSEVVPPVVLVGSSIVMAPLWSSDWKRYTGVRDVYHHHLSIHLNKCLGLAGMKGLTTFSFALPGAMISDIYLIAQKLFRGNHTPQLIVYGLSPRDFMDDLLTGETRTVVFQQLMTLADLPSLGDLYLSTLQEKVDYILNNTIYLYGKRWRYQNKLIASTQEMLTKLLSNRCLRAKATNNEPEQHFLLETNRACVWTKSLEEYRARYRHFNHAQFSKQTAFLRNLLELANSRGIHIVLVNMPLTQENISLMPANLYDCYIQTLTNLADSYKCHLLDLQSNAHFQHEHFYDTVHLNAAGGDKLIATLSGWIVAHKTQLSPEPSNDLSTSDP
ncbi:MAG: DUF1574 family protein [Candidatus Melainabacteria bacterium]|nr:DUF1574 family protein [Candidatus Melainabacteria bacterium]